jgi:hypothetical protein
MKVKKIVEGITALQKLIESDMPISISLLVKQNADKCEEVLSILRSKSEEEAEKQFEEEVDLDITKISLSKLEKIGVNLSAADITNLSWMFEFDV